jgi:hypothetical protein
MCLIYTVRNGCDQRFVTVVQGVLKYFVQDPVTAAGVTAAGVTATAAERKYECAGLLTVGDDFGYDSLLSLNSDTTSSTTVAAAATTAAVATADASSSSSSKHVPAHSYRVKSAPSGSAVCLVLSKRSYKWAVAKARVEEAAAALDSSGCEDADSAVIRGKYSVSLTVWTVPL